MAKIIKGYKQGRGVAFYDIKEGYDGPVLSKVTKDETVKLITDGKIANAKIQWWHGKPIVRLQENIVIVRITDEAGTEQTVQKRTVTNRRTEEAPVTVKSEVVGKISKKQKNETVYEHIIKKEVNEHRKLKSEVNYSGMETLEDLLDSMIIDFRLKDADKYKAMIGKKVKLNTKISSLAVMNLHSIQQSMASYLMNMCYMEIRDTYLKYVE